MKELDLYLLKDAIHFAVCAPNADRVAVMGEFNNWNTRSTSLSPRADRSGIWEGTVSHVVPGQLNRYYIQSQHHGVELIKADPFAFCAEVPPATGSRIYVLRHASQDAVASMLYLDYARKEGELGWHLLDQRAYRDLMLLVSHFNELYRSEPALHALDFSPQGFEWIEGHAAIVLKGGGHGA